jgi:hypothetical protein
VELADGWMPFGLAGHQIRQMLAEAASPPRFEVVLSTGSALDPGRNPQTTRKRLEDLRDAGATLVTGSIAADSTQHYCDQLAALKAIADTTDTGGS